MSLVSWVVSGSHWLSCYGPVLLSLSLKWFRTPNPVKTMKLVQNLVLQRTLSRVTTPLWAKRSLLWTPSLTGTRELRASFCRRSTTGMSSLTSPAAFCRRSLAGSIPSAWDSCARRCLHYLPLLWHTTGPWR
uniref:Uncharacterized protein n=1 Tax=Cacopsylla melanoneura TaxID=428564 RepID=A0A8D9BF08_9HEMI